MQVKFSASIINKPVQDYRYSNPSTFKNKSDVSFKGSGIQLFKSAKNNIYAKTDIFGKEYSFKMDDTIRDIDTLEEMIDNVRKTLTGKFVRVKNHEYFVPYILNREPNVVSQRYILENGNSVTEYNEEVKNALDVLSACMQKKIKMKDLKTVPYLRKNVPGYANNTVCNVYSYIDSVNDEIFMYIPQRNKVQVAANNGYIYRIRA